MIEENNENNIKSAECNTEKYGIGIRHLQIACMSLVLLAVFVVRCIMSVAVLAMTDQSKLGTGIDIYAWDKTTQGYILSAFFGGYALMQIPGGLLAKRFGGKATVMTALVGNTVLCCLLPTMARLGDWQMVCVCRVLMGLSQSCIVPSFHTLIGQWLPSHERTSLCGFVFGSTNIGIIIGMPISGFLAETAMGWKLIFYFSAVLLFFVSIFWWSFSASCPAEHTLIKEEEILYIESFQSKYSTKKKTFHVPWKNIFTTKGFWAIAAAHGIGVMTYIFIFVDNPTYFEKGLGISLQDSAVLSAVPYIGMLIGTVVFSQLCDFLNNKGYLTLLACRKICNSIGYFGTSVFLVALTFVDIDHKYVAICILMIMMTLQSSASAGCMVNHLDLSPNYSGVMMSLTNFGAAIFSVLAPNITSLVLNNNPADLSKWRIVFLFHAAAIGAANILYIIFATVEKQPWDDPKYVESGICDPDEIKPVLKKRTTKNNVPV